MSLSWVKLSSTKTINITDLSYTSEHMLDKVVKGDISREVIVENNVQK